MKKLIFSFYSVVFTFALLMTPMLGHAKSDDPVGHDIGTGSVVVYRSFPIISHVDDHLSCEEKAHFKCAAEYRDCVSSGNSASYCNYFRTNCTLLGDEQCAEEQLFDS